jgi:hypothetical protein
MTGITAGPRRRLWSVALAAICAAALLPAAADAAARCPDGAPAASFRPELLRHLNARQWSFGPRPTGSRAQARMLDWLAHRLRAIEGLRLRSDPFEVTSWRHPRAELTVATDAGTRELRVPAPVLLSATTGGAGTTAPLSYVAAGDPITVANAAGRIVVREAPAGTVPIGVFLPGALGFDVYDPAGTLAPGDPFRGDFLNYNARVHDLRDARAAGAAGVLFLKDLPARQLEGHNEPYEGVRWGVPAAFLGADEAEVVRAAAAAGDDATLTVSAKRRRVSTRTLVATLPGPRGSAKLVVESHTDGTNAVEDNGPVALLAMARYLATLGDRCRGRTIQLAFPTGHFYQHIASPERRHGGAGVLARRLDRQYDEGKVAGVMVLEHLGAREYAPEPRSGRPGSVLRRTGRPEMHEVIVTASEPLRAAVGDVVRKYDIKRTVILQGAEFPVPGRAPERCSFGGEGTPYNEHLLPTVASISAPMTLYNPAFGLDGIGFARMSAETRAFTELLLEMGHMGDAEIAGAVAEDRARRTAGAPGCPSDI